MVGPFTNDFVGGVLASLCVALVSMMGTFVWMLYHARPDHEPPETSAGTDPDPVPGIMATLDEEWEAANRP